MEVEEGGGEVSQLARPPRRPDVDVVRVTLTWGILLFHTTVAYAPGMTWYVKSFGWREGADWVSTVWVLFMDIWQMPMFFFLSGVSAYFALFRRTERQFREERVHRLLVPWLVLCLLNGLYSIAWLAPLTPNCEAAYRGEAGNSSTSVLEWTHCESYWVLTENTSFTKVLASLLCLWHPNHGPKDTACFSVPQASKFLGSMCFFFRPATNPEELVTAVLWWLGHPLKLAFYPILLFLLTELIRADTNLLGNLFCGLGKQF